MTEGRTKQYFLTDNGSAKPAFTVEAAGKERQRELSKKILLSSGFSARNTNSSFPVSAALQLNGDCTSMEAASLAAFAEAELERHHKISFRSYDVEADFRVCVLADAPFRLDGFLETYGGILEIEPLLVGTYHQDYPTVEELEIKVSGKKHLLNYTTKSPVNRSRCTYCGICGPVCPEQCISENLHFDFSRCTFCTDCEKSCPEKAIDLHSIERITLDIPAIIILGEPPLALPEAAASIYYQEQVPEYLATIFSCRVDEVITCDQRICHFNNSLQTGCKACLSSCRYGAVKINDNRIHIDAVSCTACGSCVSVCPTGALQNNRFTDRSFIQFFRTFHLQPNTCVIIGSDLDLHRLWWRNNRKDFKRSLFLEFPDTGSLSLMHLLFLLAHGANRIVILATTEEPNSNLNQAMREADLFCRKFFQAEGLLAICRPEDFSEHLVQNTSFSHGSKVYHDLSFVNRRQKLSSLVEFLASPMDSPLSLEKDAVRFWGTVVCDENLCTQCLACLNNCKIEALTADPDTLTLCWNGGLCIACKSCVETCPEQALTCSGQADLSRNYFSAGVISRAEPMHCAGCGKIFGTRKSFERVMAILSEKQQKPPEHLNYCEDCRVLKLMESE